MPDLNPSDPTLNVGALFNRAQQAAFMPEQEAGFGAAVWANFNDINLIANGYRATSLAVRRRFTPRDQQFNPTALINELGIQGEAAVRLSRARSAEDFSLLLRGIRDEQRRDKLMSEGGLVAGLVGGVSGALLDPLTLIPVAGQFGKGAQVARAAGQTALRTSFRLGGRTALRATASAGAAAARGRATIAAGLSHRSLAVRMATAATVGASEEAVRESLLQQLQLTRTSQETISSIGFGALFGSLVPIAGAGVRAALRRTNIVSSNAWARGFKATNRRMAELNHRGSSDPTLGILDDTIAASNPRTQRAMDTVTRLFGDDAARVAVHGRRLTTAQLEEMAAARKMFAHESLGASGEGISSLVHRSIRSLGEAMDEDLLRSASNSGVLAEIRSRLQSAGAADVYEDALMSVAAGRSAVAEQSIALEALAQLGNMGDDVIEAIRTMPDGNVGGLFSGSVKPAEVGRLIGVRFQGKGKGTMATMLNDLVNQSGSDRINWSHAADDPEGIAMSAIRGTSGEAQSHLISLAAARRGGDMAQAVQAVASEAGALIPESRMAQVIAEADSLRAAADAMNDNATLSMMRSMASRRLGNRERLDRLKVMRQRVRDDLPAVRQIVDDVDATGSSRETLESLDDAIAALSSQLHQSERVMGKLRDIRKSQLKKLSRLAGEQISDEEARAAIRQIDEDAIGALDQDERAWFELISETMRDIGLDATYNRIDEVARFAREMSDIRSKAIEIAAEASQAASTTGMGWMLKGVSQQFQAMAGQSDVARWLTSAMHPPKVFLRRQLDGLGIRTAATVRKLHAIAQAHGIAADAHLEWKRANATGEFKGDWAEFNHEVVRTMRRMGREKVSDGNAIVLRVAAKMDAFFGLLGEEAASMGKLALGDPHYVPIRYDIAKISQTMESKRAFTDRLADFLRANQEKLNLAEGESADDIAVRIRDNILGISEGARSGSSPARSRQLQELGIENELEDWMISDIGTLTSGYVNRVAGVIEAGRLIGSISRGDETGFAAIESMLAREQARKSQDLAGKDLNRLVSDFDRSREILRRQYEDLIGQPQIDTHSSTWVGRSARTIRNVAFSSMAPMMSFSALPDLSRIARILGGSEFAVSLTKMPGIIADMARDVADINELRIVADAIDVGAHKTVEMRYGLSEFVNAGPVERWSQRTANFMARVGGLTPLMSLARISGAAMAYDKFFRMADVVAGGGRLSPDDIAVLGRSGLSERDLGLLRTLGAEKSYRGLRLADISNFQSQELANRLEDAVRTLVQDIVIEPDAMTIPRGMNNSLGKFVLMFRTYMLESTSRVLGQNWQTMLANPASMRMYYGTAYAIGIGAFSNYMRELIKETASGGSPGTFVDRMSRIPMKDHLMVAIDRGGLLGVGPIIDEMLAVGMIPLLNKVGLDGDDDGGFDPSEMLFGTAQARMASADPDDFQPFNNGDILETMGGPGLSWLAGVQSSFNQLATDVGEGELRERTVRNLAAKMPGGNFLYISRAIGRLSTAFGAVPVDEER